MNNRAAGSSQALYAALAPIYDAWQSLGDVTPFWTLALDRLEAELRRRTRLPADLSFVDLGCGTGELLLALQRRHPGWRLFGVDASAAMLDVARAKACADNVAWIPCALESLDAGAEAVAGVAAAGAFHDTINHLPDQAALGKTFAALAQRVLGPGGLLVFDVTNERGFQSWWTGNRTWTGPDWEIQTECGFASDRAGGGTSHAAVSIKRDGKIVRADLTQRCFTEEVIRSALQQAGFVVESATPWSPFDIDANGKTLFVATNSSTKPIVTQ